MARRELQEINAGSMADIAFLLLIFFLVTTTMEVSSGITRMLPPLVPPDAEHPDVKERNVFIILVNKDNQLAIEDKLRDPSEIKQLCMDFFINPYNNEDLSERVLYTEKIEKLKREIIAAEQHENNNDNVKGLNEKLKMYNSVKDAFGNKIARSSGVVSLQNDRGTDYGKYIEVQDQIIAALNELRNKLSNDTWGEDFDDLSLVQQKLVKEVFPFAISEAEPKKFN